MPQLKFTTVEPQDEEEAKARETEIDGHSVERRDPHGYWWFTEPQGSRILSGAFTSLIEVRKAIHRFEQEVAPAATKKASKTETA